ncbi:hypothetical protein [Burkholderia ubonensis]|uniref:hypothetical protein n=1 Tax=Burkholderia ubonensis TaxID=101571 RepID=UPI000AA68FA7|nr:hypothetical protein [Burkholderia ubonensis]
MSFVTGQELIFKNIKLAQGVIELINKSPILAGQLIQYSHDIVSKKDFNVIAFSFQKNIGDGDGLDQYIELLSPCLIRR